MEQILKSYLILTANDVAEINRFNKAHPTREAFAGKLYSPIGEQPILLLPQKIYPVMEEYREFFSGFDLTPWVEVQSEAPVFPKYENYYTKAQQGLVRFVRAGDQEYVYAKIKQFCAEHQLVMIVFEPNKGAVCAVAFYAVEGNTPRSKEESWKSAVNELASQLIGVASFETRLCHSGI